MEITRAIGDTLSVNPLDAAGLISTFGLIGVLVIIFAETGLMVGFFFPGDSLLFLAGIAASPFANHVFQGAQVNIWGLAIGAPICAIAGAQLGHLLGARYGRRMFDRPNSRLFKRAYVDKAEDYFNRFGPAKAVIAARFIPVVRTFLNPVAGVLEMPARQFFLYNLIGGIIWTDGIVLASYFAAQKILNLVPGNSDAEKADKIDTYLVPAVVIIVLISVLPVIIEVVRGARQRRRDGSAAKHAAR